MYKIFVIFFLFLEINVAEAVSQSSDLTSDKYLLEIHLTEHTKTTGTITEKDIAEVLKNSYRFSAFNSMQLDLTTDEGKRLFRNNILTAAEAVKTFSERYIIPKDPKKRKIYFKSQKIDSSRISALRDGSINFSINFAEVRHDKITKDGWLFILCHEATHNNGSGDQYSSIKKGHTGPIGIEGYTDYEAARDCLPSLFTPHENELFVEKNKISPTISEMCGRHYSLKNDLNLCYRILSIGQTYTNWSVKREFGVSEDETLLELKGDINEPDTSIYFNEYHGYTINGRHPGPKCRQDTILRAALKMRPPPCFDGLQSYDILKLESEFDFIYGETNVRGKICAYLLKNAHSYPKSYIEKRCDWGNCVRFMRKYAIKNVSEDEVDIDYLQTLLAEVENIHKKMRPNYSSSNLTAVTNSPLLNINSIKNADENLDLISDIKVFKECKGPSRLIE